MDAKHKKPFQFGLVSLFVLLALFPASIVLVRAGKMFWREILWKGLSSPESRASGEAIVGILFVLVFLGGVGVGAWLFKNR